MYTALGLSQNQSLSAVGFPISPSSSIITGEVFRFDQGLVTQLNTGSDFTFNNSRWFSIGELNTMSQTVFGLRFQLPRRGVTFGYQDINDDNPRIQWIDDRTNPGDLEFRVADSFMSTNSTLVARMTAGGSTVFGSSSGIAPVSKVSIGNNLGESAGLYAETSLVTNATSVFAQSFGNSNSIGVRGSVGSPIGFGNFAYGIFGTAPTTAGAFAGLFNGDVHVNGTFTHTSDRKLKDNLLISEDVLTKLSQLNSYTYTFKGNKNLNLPKGLQYGFIAQELEEFYPELVSEVVHPIYNDKQELIGKETFKSVNYIGLISELTAAINELNAKVKDLEGQLETKVVYKSNFSNQELDKINKNSYQLKQNTPNPFSESTIISYALPKDQNQASLLIFDLNGRLVNSYDLVQNRGELKINATDLNGAGMYLYTLSTNGEEIITKRMILK